jgi:hypothetical protein
VHVKGVQMLIFRLSIMSNGQVCFINYVIHHYHCLISFVVKIAIKMVKDVIMSLKCLKVPK